MTKITEIEGIGPANCEKLAQADVNTTEDLLEKCKSPKGHKVLAGATGLNERKILQWVNRADLFRINGISGQYSDLLEAAGVDTAPELAQRKADNLHAKIREINERKNLVRKLPSTSQLAAWIEEAKQLPRVVTY